MNSLRLGYGEAGESQNDLTSGRKKNDMQQHHKLPGCARHTSFNKACEKAGITNSLRRLVDAQTHPFHIHLTMFEAVFLQYY